MAEVKARLAEELADMKDRLANLDDDETEADVLGTDYEPGVYRHETGALVAWDYAPGAEAEEGAPADIITEHDRTPKRRTPMTDLTPAYIAAVRDATAETIRRRAAEHELAELRANPRDEYHTMTELYEYRMLYNAHAARGWVAAGVPVVKSWRHHDGELCFGGGWFIVTAELPTGQVSNHYKADAWGLFAVPEVETAPEWDGHTPAEAADRLRDALDGDTDA